jgi:alpha-tubulin suppressor-like RCC1 family protein
MNDKVDILKKPQLLEFENAIIVSGGESHFACLDKYGMVYTWVL